MSSRSSSLGSARPAKWPRPRSTRTSAAPSRQATPTAAEMAVRGALVLVEAVGVHQRQRRRQLGRAFVMIDHDHFGAGIRAIIERLEGLGTAIDGDDQAGAFALQAHQRLARGAIAFHQPVGDIGACLQRPDLAEAGSSNAAEVAPSTS